MGRKLKRKQFEKTYIDKNGKKRLSGSGKSAKHHFEAKKGGTKFRKGEINTFMDQEWVDHRKIDLWDSRDQKESKKIYQSLRKRNDDD